MGVSWKASVPMKRRGTCPVMATNGTLSSSASAKPVTRLVAPGPEVAIHTPTRPEALAYPSAAKISPCSCRHRTFLITSDLVKAWWISIEAPPGYANRVLTPSLSRASTKMSLPFLGSSSPNLDWKLQGVGAVSDLPLLVLEPIKSVEGISASFTTATAPCCCCCSFKPNPADSWHTVSEWVALLLLHVWEFCSPLLWSTAVEKKVLEILDTWQEPFPVWWCSVWWWCLLEVVLESNLHFSAEEEGVAAAAKEACKAAAVE